MIILGQVSDDIAFEDLKEGLLMELALGPLYEDDDKTYLVWKWRPAAPKA